MILLKNGNSDNKWSTFKRRTPSRLASIVLAGSALTTGGVSAQESGSNLTQLEEIMVTARRREETLERTPVAIDVLSSQDIINKNISSENDLQTAAPGLIVRSSGNGSQINFVIRGQSLDAFSNARPGVMPYFNEVPVGGRNDGPSAFYDLGSIQVLNGPQGTLFGRNSTGGAVLFTSTKPNNEFGGYIAAQAGNYGAQKLEGALNIPLVKDTLLTRIAVISQRRDGFQKNLFNDKELGDVERDGVRLSLTFIGDTIENDLVVDYLDSGGSPMAASLYSIDPNGLLPTALLTSQQSMHNIVNAFAGANLLTQADSDAYFSANPKLNPGGLNAFLPEQLANGPYKVSINGRNEYQSKSLKFSNITKLDISENMQLKNIIGYNKLESTFWTDIDGTPYGLDDGDPTGNVNEMEQISDELQILGTLDGGNLSYVAGLYYASEEYFNLVTSELFEFPIIQSVQLNSSENENKTSAIFSQVTYDLSEATGIDGLGLTLGGRYTEEEVDIVILPDDVSFVHPTPIGLDYTQSQSFNSVSWTAGLEYQATDNLLLYMSSRRSSRNGGFNNIVSPIPLPGTQGGNRYETEETTDLELGLKFAGELAGVPTRLNLSLYGMVIDNAQRASYSLVNGAPSVLTVNVPESKVNGVQLDTQFALSSWLNVGGAVNYTDAEFTDNMVSIAGGTPTEFGTYPDTPEWSGSIYAEVSARVVDNLESTFRADVFAQSDMYFVSTGNLIPGANISGYSVTNMRWSVSHEDSGVEVALNLKNAFDKTYYVGGIALGGLFQTNVAIPGNRRTWTLEARYQF